MSRVTKQRLDTDDHSILSKHSILPEYSKQDESIKVTDTKDDYIFQQPPKIAAIQYAAQMPTDYNPFLSDERGNYFQGLINVNSEGSQNFGNERSTTENTHILTHPVKSQMANQNHLSLNLDQTNGEKHTQSKETFMPLRSPQNYQVGNGLQTPSLMERQSPQHPNETMDNFKTQPIIDVEEEPKFRDFGLKTIQDFRRETPKVKKMNELVHLDQQRLQPLMRTTFGSNIYTPLNEKEIMDKAKYQSDFVEQSESTKLNQFMQNQSDSTNIIDKAFNQMRKEHKLEHIESNKNYSRNEVQVLPGKIMTTPTDSNIAQWKERQYFTMEQEIQPYQEKFKYQSQAEYNESVQQIDDEEIHDRDNARGSNMDSPAKIKLRALSNVKMRLPTLNQGYQYQLNYVKNASMFLLNQGGVKRSQSSLAAPFYNDVGGYKDIKSKYPNLMNELNDASSPIPAFQRFQRPNSRLLRDDLRDDKIRHFVKNYKTELNKPKVFLNQFEKKNETIQEQREKLAAEDYHEDDIFKMAGKKKEIDTSELRSTMTELLQNSKETGEIMGSEYFEMKYFLNDEQLKGGLEKSKKKPILDKIMKKFQQAPKGEHKHDLSFAEAQAAVKEQYLLQIALQESQSIARADHEQNFRDTRKTVDREYQNGQFLIDDLQHKRYASQGSEYAKYLELERAKSSNLSSERNVLAETKRQFMEDAARAKKFAKKSQFAFRENLGNQNFTFNAQNINQISQIKKAPSALSKIYNEAKYYKDQQDFFQEGRDYRDYMRNTIKDFNKTITDRSENFDIKLPKQMRLRLNLKSNLSQDSQEDEYQMMSKSDRKPKPRPKKISYRELMNTRRVSSKPPPMINQQRSTIMMTSPLKGLYQKQKDLETSSSKKLVDQDGRKITSNTKVFKHQNQLFKNESLMSSYRKTLSNFNVEHSQDEYVPAHFGPPMQGMSTVKLGRPGASVTHSKQSSHVDLNSLKPSQRMSFKQIMHVEEGINEIKKNLKQQREMSSSENTF